jgi:hypothetical protein
MPYTIIASPLGNNRTGSQLDSSPEPTGFVLGVGRLAKPLIFLRLKDLTIVQGKLA